MISLLLDSKTAVFYKRYASSSNRALLWTFVLIDWHEKVLAVHKRVFCDKMGEAMA